MTPVRSIQPDVFIVEPTPRLLGGYSPTSEQFHFPLQSVCPYSGAQDVVSVELSDRATVWGHTVVTAPPPGYEGPIPYGFGVVELTRERLRIVTRLVIDDVAQVAFGDSAVLTFDIVGHDEDGTAVAVWAFAKVAP